MIDYVNQETFVSSLLLVSSFVVGPNPAIFGSNMNGNKIFLAASSVIIWYAFSRKVPTIHNYTYASRVVTCTCRLAVALLVIRFIASGYPSEHLNKLFFKYHWKAQIGRKKNTEYLQCILSVTAPTKLIMLGCCPTCVAKKFILAIIKSLSSSLKEARTNAYTFEQ
jgi:hypothetical protein